ncbi:LacI family DNA-binding transcriptional regulator [Streptomyces sp. NPDC090131]|uniref:LacI family DNA-binding transcriptional regulator n=1 Tax=Streptomyces sp. NPDC090131 TaxID=3365954 RepID=UPI003809CBB4
MINDVARAAGVSAATISRVFNAGGHRRTRRARPAVRRRTALRPEPGGPGPADATLQRDQPDHPRRSEPLLHRTRARCRGRRTGMESKTFEKGRPGQTRGYRKRTPQGWGLLERTRRTLPFPPAACGRFARTTGCRPDPYGTRAPRAPAPSPAGNPGRPASPRRRRSYRRPRATNPDGSSPTPLRPPARSAGKDSCASPAFLHARAAAPPAPLPHRPGSITSPRPTNSPPRRTDSVRRTPSVRTRQTRHPGPRDDPGASRTPAGSARGASATAAG